MKVKCLRSVFDTTAGVTYEVKLQPPPSYYVKDDLMFVDIVDDVGCSWVMSNYGDAKEFEVIE